MAQFSQFFALVLGRELEDGSVHLAPWKVQQLIADGLCQRSRCHDHVIASQACLQLAICHYMGFGVERDQVRVLEYIDRAAADGCFEARRIRHRLYEAFSKPMGTLDVVFKGDDVEERQLSRLLAVEMASAEVNAFEVFDSVGQEDYRSRSSNTVLSLHQAAYLGDLERMRKLLDGKGDFQDKEGRTAFFLAVKGRQLDAMKLLLEIGGSDPNLADEDGHTPIHMLIMFGSAEVEAALSLMFGSSRELNLDCFSSNPRDAWEHWAQLWGAPLHWTVLAGNRAMTSCLVKAGARVHDWPEEMCPIRMAASLHLSAIFDILLSAMPRNVSLLGPNPLFALSSSNPFRRLLLHGKNYVSEIEETVAILSRKFPVIEEEVQSWNGNPLRKILVLNSSDGERYIAKALVANGAAEDRYKGLVYDRKSGGFGP